MGGDTINKHCKYKMRMNRNQKVMTFLRISSIAFINILNFWRKTILDRKLEYEDGILNGKLYFLYERATLRLPAEFYRKSLACMIKEKWTNREWYANGLEKQNWPWTTCLPNLKELEWGTGLGRANKDHVLKIHR